MTFQLTRNVNVERDEKGVVRQLEHVQEPFVPQPSAGLGDEAELTPRAVAEDYLRQVAPIYGINAGALAGGVEGFADDAGPQGAGAEIEFAEEKPMMGTTMLSYVQTFQGVPVWEAGVNVTVQAAPARVTSSQSSVQLDIRADEAGFDDAGGRYTPEGINEGVLSELLNQDEFRVTKINDVRPYYYSFNPEERFDPELRIGEETGLEHRPPTMSLPPLPEHITPGVLYKVTEVLFTTRARGWGMPTGEGEGGGESELNWSALVEVRTGAVLRLRALVACAAFGLVYRFDPVTATGNAALTPASGDAELDPLRTPVSLEGLAEADPQGLSGAFVRLLDVGSPAVPPPVASNEEIDPLKPKRFNFRFPVRSNEFAAVNAYHHCDWLFRMMEGMGFDVRAYFDGTAFPVRVDHRDLGAAVNAQAPGNALRNGSDGFRFALASPGQPVGIAADVRVVLHEFGHTLLWDHVHSPNFGFAHSAGDSLAAILCDPQSALASDPSRRFLTFPWITSIRVRRHDRAVAEGWAWGGANDIGGYDSEQILSTTLFRLYRSVGGDDPHRNVKTAASRYVAYLIMRAIGSLPPHTVTPTRRPDSYATKLIEADAGTRAFEGRPGGTMHKVIRWSFEKQGLYQPAGAPAPVLSEGAPPPVDVYIDDGRAGEYGYTQNVWGTADIWNRVAPDGGLEHQAPAGGATNYVYVRVRNRGTSQAENVSVRGYTSRLGAGLVWPDDWQPMATAVLPVAGGIEPGGAAVAGPFQWAAPQSGQAGLLMSVSASGDLSNIDPNSFLPCAAGPTPEWMLVPFDNNLARRNVTVVAAGGLTDAFAGNQFEVKNGSAADVQVELKAVLPDSLTARGWGVRFDNPGGASFTLGPGKRRAVFPGLMPGDAPDAADGGGASIDVQVYMDGALAGVVSYDVSRNLQPTGDDSAAAPAGGEALAPLLSLLNSSLGPVKSVTVRRLSVDIELGDS